MAGTVIPPVPLAGVDATPSFVNSFRISAVADRLAMHVRAASKNDTIEFFNLCLALARGIDFAVANIEVPSRAPELPLLLKQVCQRKSDFLLQAAIMVLMISVKNACKNGWFSEKDTKELLTLANEIGSSFCSARDNNTEASSFLPTISTIMSRFYPRMKLGQILAFLEVKPGYGAFVLDFHISKNAKSSPEDKIRLFVAQIDNIETSSCLTSPPKVNFLLNGKGVEKRTTVFVDTGPQIPTVVTHMLKYGTNLLQAVGQFQGNYILVVAFMSLISTPNIPALHYVQPAVAALDSDSEIIEGPSRISLNCPISFRRIRTPVKGHSCKHIQCFDHENFVDINSRRPSWRCPHCNQFVCFTDLRIDQNMVKVLEEVGENVTDVIISADGSWKAVMETDDHTDKPHDKPPICKPDGSMQQDTIISSNAPPDIYDLTEGNDEMDAVGTCENEDRKPLAANFQSQSNVKNLTINPNMNNASEVNQNTASPIEDDFWSGIYLSTYGSGTSSQISCGVSESTPTNLLLSPVLTDAISPALNRGTALLATSVAQSQISASNNFHVQQFGNSIISNEYGMLTPIARHVNRTPIAVQALPAQTPTPVPQQRSRANLNTLIHNGPPAASQTSPALPMIADSFNAVSNNIERQQQFSRSHLNPLQVPHMSSASLQQNLGSQNWAHQDHSFISSQPMQQNGGFSAPGSYRVSSALLTDLQNPHLQQSLRMPHGMSQSPSLIRSSAQSSAHFPRTQIHQGGTQSGVVQTAGTGSSQHAVHFPRTQIHQGGTQSGVGQTTGTGSSPHARFMVAAQRAAQMARQSPSTPVPIQTSRASSSFPGNADGFRASVGEQRGNSGGTVQLVTTAENLVDSPAEQNWRPTGRMRGSLSGRAYSDALNQYIIQPTQPVQAAARPLSNMTSPPSAVPPQLQVLMANSRNAHAPQAVNYPLTEPTSMAGGSGVLPERSSGMH